MRKISILRIAIPALFLAGIICVPGYAEEKKDKTAEQPAITHLYGNHSCPVTGEPVVPDASITYENKEKGIFGRIYLCCMPCAKKAKKNLDELYNKFYRTDPKTGKAIEPRDLKNDKCPMSGEPVDAKTKIEYNGMIIHFCCKDCAEGFLKDPEPKLSKLLPDAKEFEFTPNPEGDHHKMH